jgi:hypothetical protein
VFIVGDASLQEWRDCFSSIGLVDPGREVS